MSISSYPYLQLERAVKISIAKDLLEIDQNNRTFTIRYETAVKLMAGKVTEIDDESQILLQLLNQYAQDFLDKNVVASWKQSIQEITDLVPYCQTAQQILKWGNLGMGAMALFALRSSRLLSIANGCAGLALYILSITMGKFAEGFQSHKNILQNLSTQNINEFSGKVDGVYEGLEKSNFILRYYFGAKKKELGAQEHKGLFLLKEELKAIQSLKDYGLAALLIIYKGIKSFPSLEDKTINLDEICRFFTRFEALNRKGLLLSLGAVVLGLAYTYYAYVQRAYVMVVAGITYTVVSALFSNILNGQRAISHKITQADDSNLLEIYQRERPKISLLLSAKDLNAVHTRVVIPLDAILKLLPN